jgi:GTP-binding protein Era
MMMHKAGFVNILGKPNVGKSTLMNALLGEKLSIATAKAQTTRHRIMGLANGDDFQLVFSDTPGILDPKYPLHERMMNYVDEALKDADVILLVAEAGDSPESGDSLYTRVVEKLAKFDIPVVVAVNKIDRKLPEEAEADQQKWQTALPKAEVFLISALHKTGLDELNKRLIALLPENPPSYDNDSLSDRPLRFFASEIIREKIFLHYKKEIPYSCEVDIEEYREDAEIDRIRALIYVERDSQKGILIGHKGEALKKTASDARADLEKFLGKKVYLEVFVKVKTDWRKNEGFLKRFGY